MTRLAVLAALLAACGGSGSGGTGLGTGASDPIPVGDVATAREAVGKAVVVIGTAEAAKAGPIVTAGDLVVYCLDMGAWPEAMVGGQVTARGTLDLSEQNGTQGPSGEIQAGIDGSIFVLRGCTFEPAGR